MKQRLGIANVILHDPELLILDEPTNGLDPIGIAEVRNFIKGLSAERGKTILISSHILSEIALLADDIGIIDHGVLLEENSMEDLEKKNRKYIQLQVSDVHKTSLILEQQFRVTDYAVQDEHKVRENASFTYRPQNGVLVGRSDHSFQIFQKFFLCSRQTLNNAWMLNTLGLCNLPHCQAVYKIQPKTAALG